MTTLKAPVSLSGVGLHSGAQVTVTLNPAKPGSGRYFQRVDLPNGVTIPANLSCVREAMLSTELGEPGEAVRTVEHLLASLVGLGVEDLEIAVDGSEMPLLDGSAQEWVTAITGVGVTPPDDSEGSISLQTPIQLYEGDAFVAVFPCEQLRFSYGIDFPYAPIGKQWLTWSPDQEDFTTAIAPARTFGFADQVEQLRQAGLIQGGSLENALVCDQERWLNPPLRFADEPVRHKILDFLGDLSLLGQIPVAHYVAYKASHRLHIQLAQKIQTLVG